MAKIKESQAYLRRQPLPKVSVTNSQKDLPFSRVAVRKLVRKLLAHLKVQCDEIDIHFVTKRAIAKLHEEHFGDKAPTDTISFPLDKTHLGIVFVCPAIAQEYAVKHNLDPYEETTLYLVHGILHLLGYDDLTPKERRKMRKKERECLRALELNLSSKRQKHRIETAAKKIDFTKSIH